MYEIWLVINILWEIALGNPAPAPLVAVGVAMTAFALVLLLKD